MSRWKVSGTSYERIETVVEVHQQFAERHVLHAGRGKLNGEG